MSFEIPRSRCVYLGSIQAHLQPLPWIWHFFNSHCDFPDAWMLLVTIFYERKYSPSSTRQELNNSLSLCLVTHVGAHVSFRNLSSILLLPDPSSKTSEKKFALTDLKFAFQSPHYFLLLQHCISESARQRNSCEISNSFYQDTNTSPLFGP